MSQRPSQSDLEAYLDEGLPTAVMARIEQALRDEPKLAEQLVAINARRDAGVHSLGEIWRRHRLSCPSREQLGSFLLGVLSADIAGFVRFHLEVSGCRTCAANLDDLKNRQVDEPAAVDSRRKKYFHSSAGHLKRK
ncbi:MAG: hypothetical protein HY288_19100 [Planctomycetia bacterium]|nr:hypothetical protein [Planctomycetia bacterium]